MKTKKVLILILLVIIAISATACVDKDSVEYIYNIRRFVGEYESFERGIFMSSSDLLDPDIFKDNIFYDNICGEVSTNGYNKVSPNGEISFVEKDIEQEAVEFFNHYLKILEEGKLKITRKKVNFLVTELSLKIKGALPPGPQDMIDRNIYHGNKVLILDEKSDPNVSLILGYALLSQETKYVPSIDVTIRKIYIDKNNRERKILLSLTYVIK